MKATLSRLTAVVPLLVGALLSRPALGKGRADLARGIVAYDQGRYDEAERWLTDASRTLRERGERAKAWLYLGLTRAERKDIARVRYYFRRAVVEDPEVKIDRERVPPVIVAEFDAVRRTTLGILHVLANEKGARVFVNGRERGPTPLRLSLPVGRYTVRVQSHDGRRLFQRSGVLIRVQAPTKLVARLAEPIGTLKVTVAPRDAALYEDNRRLSIGPGGLLRLPLGRHRIRAHRPGYQDESRVLDIRAGDNGSLQLRLTPPGWYARRRTWGWISAGISGAALVTALLVGRSARAAGDEIARLDSAGSLDYDRYRVLVAGVDSNSRIANVFFGVTGAAAITAILLVLTSRDRPRDRPRRGWRIQPGAGGASIAARF